VIVWMVELLRRDLKGTGIGMGIGIGIGIGIGVEREGHGSKRVHRDFLPVIRRSQVVESLEY
jgi:hypothetical protein